MTARSLRLEGRPEAAASPFAATLATTWSRWKLSTAGRPLAPQAFELGIRPELVAGGNALVLRIDLALAGKVDPAQIQPVPEPLSGAARSTDAVTLMPRSRSPCPVAVRNGVCTSSCSRLRLSGWR